MKTDRDSFHILFGFLLFSDLLSVLISVHPW